MSGLTPGQQAFFSSDHTDTKALKLGFRFGDKGTHTSRTIMFDELVATLASVSSESDRSEYANAIVETNCTSKSTIATRRLTNQRLGEVYALDPRLPIFRALRTAWDLDQSGRPLLALLVALARDPLLRATAHAVISLSPEAEFHRAPMRDALRATVGERLNESTLNKVVRNASSSWTQSGHLSGRTHKVRRTVPATPPSIALALYLSYGGGFRGEELLSSAWVSVLDTTPTTARDLALQAKRQGLLDLRIGGGVFVVSFERLDPLMRS